MDHHYSDLLHAEIQSNSTLAKRIAELTRQNSTLEHDLKLMKADRDRLIDELAKRWPDSKRVDIIGQNGNTGEHYAKTSEPIRYMVGSAIFHTKCGAEDCSKVCLSSGVEHVIIPLYAGEPMETPE